jgi:uncharacterized membrane protein YcaP (DUF421 family)
MWFDTWSDLVRVVVVGTAAYAWLVLILRVSGKRTLAKLNAFDLVVTVAIGSTLATILLDSNVAWSEGATALALLVALQLLVAFVTARAERVRDVVTARPTLLVADGEIRHDVRRRMRVAEAEIRQGLRSSGLGGLHEVGAMVLETDGTLSVIPRESRGDGWALQDVSR